MKKNTVKVKDLMRKYAIYGMVASALFLGSCGSDDGKVEINKYDNVITKIVEQEPGKFKIESETKTSGPKSLVLVHKLDGKVDTLDMQDTKKLYAGKDPLKGYNDTGSNQQYYNSHQSDMSSMWFLLYWSNFGYHLGRPYNYPVYRNVYSSPASYSTARQTQSSVVKSRTPVRVSKTSSKMPVKTSKTSYSKPSSSSKGFGSSSSRSYGG